MWQNLTKLSLAIDPEIIGYEGFDVKGITTAYFLPFPALIRGLLSLVGMSSSAILSNLLGSLTFSIASLLIWARLFSKLPNTNWGLKKYLWIAGVMLCTILSPMIGMMSYPTVFWEAIIWASALFLMASYLSISLIFAAQEKKSKRILFLLFTAVGGLALFTRATYSFATCLLYALTIAQIIWIQRRSSGISFQAIFNNKLLLVNTLLFSLCVSSLLMFNYAKWGNPFEFYPLKHYKMWTEEQKQKYFSHGALSLTRVPQTFTYYFVPAPDNFSSTSSKLIMGNSAQFGKTSTFDYKEPRLSITLTQPLAVSLFLLGFVAMIWSALRRRSEQYQAVLPAALISIIPIVFILSIHSLSIRYAGDFLPAFMIFGLFGLFQAGVSLQARNSRKQVLKQSRNAGRLYKSATVGLSLAVIAVTLYLSSAGILLQNEYWKIPFLNFNLIPIEKGETVLFKLHGNNDKGNGYLYSGWSQDLESFGAWSNSPNPTLLVLPPKNFQANDSLLLKTRAFVTPNHPEQVVDIWVNGKLNQTVALTNPELNEIVIRAPFSIHWLSSPKYIGISLFNLLTKAVGTSNQEPIFIKFNLHNPARPKDLGLGDDDRLLGIGLISITLQ